MHVYYILTHTEGCLKTFQQTEQKQPQEKLFQLFPNTLVDMLKT